jgi:hypothetical protein
MFWLAKGSYIELSTLNLANNKLTVEGAIILSKAEWPVLVYVNFTDNNIAVK